MKYGNSSAEEEKKIGYCLFKKHTTNFIIQVANNFWDSPLFSVIEIKAVETLSKSLLSTQLITIWQFLLAVE